MKNRNYFIKLFLYILLPFMLIGLGIGSLAWYAISEDQILDTHINQGLVIQQYFHCGSGTETDPYVITRPIHYYHLAELYQRRSGFANQYRYFQLGYDLDGDGDLEVYNYDDYGEVDSTNPYSDTLNMAYYSGNLALIPVGTSSVPFNGQFDGSGLTIANLNIISSETIGEITYGTCDVGIFGYVGTGFNTDSDDNKTTLTDSSNNVVDSLIHDVYFDNVTISLVGASLEADCISSNETSAGSAHISDGNTSGSKDTIYVGYLIGHLYEFYNAQGRNYTDGTVASDATPISNVYLNNVSIIGGSQTSAITLNQFGYIGYIDLIDGEEAITINKYYDEIVDYNTGDEGWGGSIDMQQLYDRIVEINDLASDTRGYPTAETIYGNASIREAALVTVDSLSSSNYMYGSSRNGYTEYYWSAAKTAGTGVKSDLTGGTYVGTFTSTWNYLYSLGSTTVPTTTYSKTGDIVDAYYIYDNGSYLMYDPSSNAFTSTTKTSEASKFIPSSTANPTKYYCLYYNQEIYLNATTGTTPTITVGTSEDTATTWTKNNNNTFYTTIDEVNYFLNNDDTWTLVESSTKWYISDGTHYLIANASGVSSTTNVSDAYMWVVEDGTDSTAFYYTSGSDKYYLTYNGTLTTVKNTQFLWTKELKQESGSSNYKTYYSCTVNNLKYYLIYDNGWKVDLINGYYIYNGDRYIGYDSSYNITSVGKSKATLFQVSEVTVGDTTQYSLAAAINGEARYLTNNGMTVLLNDGSSIDTWYKEEIKDSNDNIIGYTFYKKITHTINGKDIENKFYLTYTDQWELSLTSGYVFKDDTHYMTSDTSTSTYTITEGYEESAILWQRYDLSNNQYYLYTFIEGELLYLSITSKGLVLSSTPYTWNYDSVNNGYYSTLSRTEVINNVSTSLGTDDVYITYNESTSTWELTVLKGKKITDGDGHYIGYKNAAIINTNENNAAVWQIYNITGSEYYIYYVDTLGARKYLGIADGALAITSTSFKWNYISEQTGTFEFYKNVTEDGETVSEYLYYDDNLGWTLMEIASLKKIAFEYYTNGTATKVYLTTSGSGLSYTTDADSAVTWIQKGETIYTVISGNKYYLSYEVKDEKTYKIVNEERVYTGLTKVITPTVSTTNNLSWGISNSTETVINNKTYTYCNYYASIQGVNHYLYFDYSTNSFKFEVLDGFRLTDGSGNYVSVDTHFNSSTVSLGTPTITVGTNDESYPFYEEEYNGVKYYFTLVGDTKYYLTHANDPKSDMSLSLTSSRPDSTIGIEIDGTNLCATCQGKTFSLALTSSNTWEFIPQGYYSIALEYGGKTYYLEHDTDSTDLLCVEKTSDEYSYRHYDWTFTSETNFYCSCIIDGTTYYLYASQNGNVSLSTDTKTWNYTSSDKTLKTCYTSLDGTTGYYFYLMTDGSEFYVELMDYTSIYVESGSTKYYLTNNLTTNYLTGSTSKLNINGNSYNTKWIIENNKLLTVYNNGYNYLVFTEGTGFSWSTVKGGGTTINYDSDLKSYYFTGSSGVKYYLFYDSSANYWYVDRIDYKYIYTNIGGTNYYLTADTNTSSPTFTSVTSGNLTKANRWYVTTNSDGTIYLSTMINNTMYYLQYSAFGTLTYSTSSSAGCALKLTKAADSSDDDIDISKYVFSGANTFGSSSLDFYLLCDSTTHNWYVDVKDYCYISYNDGTNTNYMTISAVTGDTLLGNSTDTPFKWYIINNTLAGIYNNKLYYLSFTEHYGFTMTEGSSNITYNGTLVNGSVNINWTSNGITYYLIYGTSGWNIASNQQYYIYISENAGYINFAGEDATNPFVSSSSATKSFMFTNSAATNGSNTTACDVSSKIYTYSHGRAYYINFNGSAMTTSTSGTTDWENHFNVLRTTYNSGYYYMTFSSSTLTATQRDEFYIGYKYGSTWYYLTTGTDRGIYFEVGTSTSMEYTIISDLFKTVNGSGYFKIDRNYSDTYLNEKDSRDGYGRYGSYYNRVTYTNNNGVLKGDDYYLTFDNGHFTARSKSGVALSFIPNYTMSYTLNASSGQNETIAVYSNTINNIYKQSNVGAPSVIKTSSDKDEICTYLYSKLSNNLTNIIYKTFKYITSATDSTGIIPINSYIKQASISDTTDYQSTIVSYSGLPGNNNETVNGMQKLVIQFNGSIYESGTTLNHDYTSSALGYNLRFDGRGINNYSTCSITDGQGSGLTNDNESLNPYCIIVRVTAEMIASDPQLYGYNYHTLELVCYTECEDVVIEPFTLYLVNGSWTTVMPSDYGIGFINGRSVYEDVDTLHPFLYTSSDIVYNCVDMINEVIDDYGYLSDEITIQPTAINVISSTSDPTVNMISTNDQLYTSTTTNYKRGTYLALKLDTDDNGDYYSDYHASYKNTGYIVGGSYSSASGSGIGDIRVSGYSISNISGSYNSSSDTFSTIYTFNDSGSSPVAINNNSNTYEWYDYSKELFGATLKSSGSYVYGLHFMEAEISTEHLMTAESVVIQNKYYYNYELPESSIDFNVYTKGSIILYGGDYYTSGNSSFFSLHKVFRNSTNPCKIDAIMEIIEIYAKESMGEKENYIYKLKDSSGNYWYTTSKNNDKYDNLSSTLDSDYTVCVFKTKWLTSPADGNDFDNSYIYYFEVPCNKGEYCLGSVSGSYGGYLLYLDIAANGTQGYTFNQEAYIGTDPLMTQIEYLSEGTTINSKIHFSYTLPSGNSSTNFSFKVSYDPDTIVYDSTNNVSCTIYTIEITNTTGSPLDMLVIMIDNDDDAENEYPYRYKIIYNGVEYTLGSAYDPNIGCYYASSEYNLPAA